MTNRIMGILSFNQTVFEIKIRHQIKWWAIPLFFFFTLHLICRIPRFKQIVVRLAPIFSQPNSHKFWKKFIFLVVGNMVNIFMLFLGIVMALAALLFCFEHRLLLMGNTIWTFFSRSLPWNLLYSWKLCPLFKICISDWIEGLKLIKWL